MAKILREHFVGETPVVTNISEQKALIASLKSKLKQIKNVDISTYHHYRDEQESDLSCSFSISEKESYRFYSSSFTLKFNQQNELILSYYNEPTFVYELEQVYSFIERLKEEYENKNARGLRRKKINQLKQHAIIAKIKEIAKEEQFDFYTQEYQRKLKLTVRIEGGIVEVDIPYKQFQDVLKELRSLLQTIKEIRKSGIHFKLKSDLNHRGYGWITHDSL
jgi:hypothetical protein